MTAEIPAGAITGLVGPDGAGKTTFLRLAAGLLVPTQGRISVLGRDTRQGLEFRDHLAYMPQKFGLYEDLTVLENLLLYARLRGVPRAERQADIERLLGFTGLTPFQRRLAGNLSGGMKQKLGLACSMLIRPKVMLLDEPGVGVDPISRRELWKIVSEQRDQGVGIVWSTPYLDEAERCDHVLVLYQGRLLFFGPPKEFTARVQSRTFLVEVPGQERRRLTREWLMDPAVVDTRIQGRRLRVVLRAGADAAAKQVAGSGMVAVEPRFEDAFIDALGGVPKERIALRGNGSNDADHHEEVVAAENLVQRFGRFTAVDHVSFRVRRGEVFGLLGPNGAGKSTTFRMLCGLAAPTEGRATVAGVDLGKARAEARRHVGYMAQKFSLYGNLTVRQNLEFFGGVYGLWGTRLADAVERSLEELELRPFADGNAGLLPLGFKQRLALAVAVMHRPAVVFLDEPTSGVDPLARREFWLRIDRLVEEGAAVIVTTHFMDEAEYCDRLALINRGRVIAMDTPDAVRTAVQSPDLPHPTLEDAFLALLERAENEDPKDRKAVAAEAVGGGKEGHAS
ncbi:MAG: ABC transporter ATP-binding protein [Thermogutta sp.]|nr:ABC transporter ATP-binding protein [Thermogutta sp.]